MINVFNFFNKVYEDLSDKNFNYDEDLVKYFKSEYGNEDRQRNCHDAGTAKTGSCPNDHAEDKTQKHH